MRRIHRLSRRRRIFAVYRRCDRMPRLLRGALTTDRLIVSPTLSWRQATNLAVISQ